MVSLLIRNLVFTILHPGLVAGLIPFWILGNKAKQAFKGNLLFYQYFAILVFAIGLVILFHCIINFAVKGRGTLSPADPTKKLVDAGLYKSSRNPMYVGVMIILIAEAVFFASYNLVIYLLFTFVAFNLFVLLVEEPRLRKDFGEEYYHYCKKVRRWF